MVTGQRTINDYEIVRQLGAGAFGKVYDAIRPDRKHIALKVIDIPPDKPELVDQTKIELQNLQTLANPQCNPYVICYYAGYDNPETRQFFVEMELIEGEELGSYINRLKQIQPPAVVYYHLLLVAKGIAEGLRYSHRKGIVHNDIKPSNIMVDKNGVPRIIDYGLACSSGSAGERGRYCMNSGGSPNYIPPEFILNNGIRYPASDMWALGISLYELASGGLPFNTTGVTTPQQIFAIIRDQQPAKLNTPNQQLNNVVNGLLIRDPTQRLTSDQMINMLRVIPPVGFQPQAQAQIPVFQEPLSAMDISESGGGIKPMDISRQKSVNLYNLLLGPAGFL